MDDWKSNFNLWLIKSDTDKYLVIAEKKCSRDDVKFVVWPDLVAKEKPEGAKFYVKSPSHPSNTAEIDKVLENAYEIERHDESEGYIVTYNGLQYTFSRNREKIRI